MKYIYAIEISGICNLKCAYCPHPNSKRKKGLMNKRTFLKSMSLVKKLNQDFVCLHNFGEPLMHPKLIEFIKIAKKQVKHIVLSTNGILLTREMAISLKNAGLTRLYISSHSIKTGLKALYNCRGLNLVKEFRCVFFHDWANTAPKKNIFSKIFKRLPKPKACCFVKNDWVVILWDGRINSCCIDMEGKGIIGSVFDKNLEKIKVKPFSLCKDCHKPLHVTESYYYTKKDS